jgi:hypothetical protein
MVCCCSVQGWDGEGEDDVTAAGFGEGATGFFMMAEGAADALFASFRDAGAGAAPASASPVNASFGTHAVATLVLDFIGDPSDMSRSELEDSCSHVGACNGEGALRGNSGSSSSCSSNNYYY